MNKRSCLTAIQQKYGLLTPVEKRIADFILLHADTVVSMSVAELAQNADAAKSAVIRLAKTLGFDGYAELKLALAMELSKNRSFNFVPYIEKNDGAEQILDKIFSANVKTLHDTAEALDRAALCEIVEQIDRARVVYVYGIGTSAALANDFQYRLTQVGYTAICFTDVPSMKVSTLNIRKGDVAFAISNSGQTVATIDALTLAREMGAYTVCLTGYPDSRLTEVADRSLVISTDEIRYPVEAISARIAHISVLDTIVISLSAKHFETAVERAEKTRDFVNRGRYVTKKNL